MTKIKLKKHIMNQKNVFQKWVNQLTVAQYAQIRKEIIQECHISRQIFSHWKNSNTQVPPLAQEKINLIAKKYQLSEVFNIKNNKTL